MIDEEPQHTTVPLRMPVCARHEREGWLIFIVLVIGTRLRRCEIVSITSLLGQNGKTYAHQRHAQHGPPKVSRNRARSGRSSFVQLEVQLRVRMV